MVIFSFFLVGVAFLFLLGVPAFAAAFPDPLVAPFGWTTSGVLND
tara:strand:+ start:419 stop:553 length:135 start_codon:yes stop_codon:yes gene_type:complete